jgi:transposase
MTAHLVLVTSKITIYGVAVMGFIDVDRSSPVSSPGSVEDLVPDNHLAKFVSFIVSLLDLSKFTSQYSGRGKDAYPPSMMLTLLLYSYMTGVTSCQKWNVTQMMFQLICIFVA